MPIVTTEVKVVIDDYVNNEMSGQLIPTIHEGRTAASEITGLTTNPLSQGYNCKL